MLDDLLDTVAGTPGRMVGLGVALGLGVVLGRGVRPVAKTAIRGYLAVADRMREMTAEAGESMQDLYAEARAEHEQTNQGQPAEGVPS